MKKLGLIGIILLFPQIALASGANDTVASVLIGLVVLLLAATLGGYAMKLIHQPAVLGELFAGMVLGNLTLFGFGWFEFISSEEVFHIFAEIGVILLLFEVGLESSIEDLLKVGLSATLVAVIGVIAPFVLGYFISIYFMPDKSHYVHAFIGATLCATSVGITARVLKDLGKIHLKESKIILGAAVIDDVLGLIILAVVSGVIMSASGGETLSTWQISWISIKAIGFLILALIIGTKVAPTLFRYGAKLRMEGVLLAFSISFCFILAYLSSLVGLAPIVGAFAAGLIIDGTGYSKFFSSSNKEASIEHLIFPISKFFVPVFFVHMGMQVDVTTFFDYKVVLFGLSLTAVAIIGKQVCGLGVFGKDAKGIKRLVIGLGMIPRGEVGLIFAAIGAKLLMDGKPVIDAPLYSSIVLMVMLTTIITPPGLKWSLRRT